MKINYLFAFLFLTNFAFAEPSPEGTWSVVGKDDAKTSWKAKLVLKSDDKDNYPPQKFKGYFDWVGDNGMTGREYIIQGDFNYDTRVLRLVGTELEDAHPGIKTSLYTIEMNKNADKLENGFWKSCGVVPGVWEATRVFDAKEKAPRKNSKKRTDIPSEKCEGGVCPLPEKVAK